jgi:hypothetical protein
MEATERRLGKRPKYGAWDTAYDAFYVCEYFHHAGGFAAVPLNVGKRGGGRRFSFPRTAYRCARRSWRCR